MKAISFLGLGKYEKTTYRYHGIDACTKYFSAALPTFFPAIDKVLVFVTPSVEAHENFAGLSSQLGDMMEPVRIPDGHSEQDLWAIFDRLTSYVLAEETVIFDITNSFRSLPFLSFLAAAYLRTALKVTVKSIVYGAYEARVDGISPVFDLTSFIGLLDWTTATDQFIHTGDARRLAQLLNPSGAKKGAAFDASNTLSTVSLAAFLCQPFPLMPEAQQLEERLQAAEMQFEVDARPYRTLRRQIVDEFGSFGASNDAAPQVQLRTQFRMIEWYQRNNQIIQAVTLAREWLISAVTIRLGETIDLRRTQRETMERAVSGLGMLKQKIREPGGIERLFGPDDLNKYGRRILDTWPEAERLRRLWGNLSAVRNTLDHAGYQQGAMAVSKIISKFNDQILPELRSLAVEWKFMELTDDPT